MYICHFQRENWLYITWKNYCVIEIEVIYVLKMEYVHFKETEDLTWITNLSIKRSKVWNEHLKICTLIKKTNSMNIEYVNVILSLLWKLPSFWLTEMLRCNDLIPFIVDANSLRSMTYNLIYKLLIWYELWLMAYCRKRLKCSKCAPLFSKHKFSLCLKFHKILLSICGTWQALLILSVMFKFCCLDFLIYSIFHIFP